MNAADPAVDAANLVERYMPLAKSVARKWGDRYPPLRDEFLSEAVFGLWKAALRHEPERGRAFPTLAHIVIRQNLWTLVQTEHRKHPATFRSQRSESDPDNPLDLIPDRRRDPVESIDLHEFIAATDLNPVDAVVVREALAGRTFSEIAADLGCGVTRAGQRWLRAVTKMRVKAKMPI